MHGHFWSARTAEPLEPSPLNALFRAEKYLPT
jgi:hypothetical protein